MEALEGQYVVKTKGAGRGTVGELWVDCSSITGKILVKWNPFPALSVKRSRKAWTTSETLREQGVLPLPQETLHEVLAQRIEDEMAERNGWINFDEEFRRLQAAWDKLARAAEAETETNAV